ncbi:basic secretory protein-like protein [Verrucomicrobium spinosum]|uniref:basic secretory protein-like protein n=1 Tax=Verrucomicrobium spinosum TaxID=2736 RepID=UPI00155DCC32|nr:basic secretory protein-like protein [Verrucomicrobium spinosum]
MFRSANTAVALAIAVFAWVPPLNAQTTNGPRVPELIQPLVSRGLKVTVDTSGAPECADWAERAKEMVELWHPIVSAYLDAPLDPSEKEIHLVFKEMKGVAATSKNVITIASGWVKSHPNDLGMVLHELVHVVQDYPPTQSVWLIEGIADYIRFWMAEPEGQPKQFNRAKDNYRNGYRTTGASWPGSKSSTRPLSCATRISRCAVPPTKTTSLRRKRARTSTPLGGVHGPH